MKMLGNIVREARKDQKLTISNVARIMGIHPTLLGRIELCQTQPTQRQVLELSEILKIDDDELMANYLSERIVWKIKDERLALQAISLAEQKLKWLDSQNLLTLATKIKVSYKSVITTTPKYPVFRRTRSQKHPDNGSPRTLYTSEQPNKINVNHAAETPTPTYVNNHENKNPKATE